MKPGIHPEYKVVNVHCACGTTWTTRSTKGQELRLEICSSCHPFFTGQAEADRLRRPRRALHPQVRQEEGAGRPGPALAARGPTPARGAWRARAGVSSFWTREARMDSITFEKLKDIEARFAEVEAAMSDQDVARDPSAYQKLAKESKEIAPIVDRYRAYKAALGELTKVQEMVRVGVRPRACGRWPTRSCGRWRRAATRSTPRSRCCSSPRTRTTRRTCCWRSARARAARRPRCSRPRSSACTRASRSGRAGRSTSSP